MTHVSKAMSCGVCFRMWTFSFLTFVETVAVGFCSSGRYDGPRHWAGAPLLSEDAIVNLAEVSRFWVFVEYIGG
jgi:hypothetical protein